MKLNVHDLTKHLAKKPAPIYIVSGDEPLQVGECCDAIRQCARENGYSERRVLNVDKNFDWGSFLAVSNSMSLFAERQLIELRMPASKPGDKGTEALLEYVEKLPEDSMLLVICSKLDKQSQRSKWFQQCEAAGVFIAVWPVELQQLPAWIHKRAANKSLNLSKTAINYIVERVEGNMLAAAQELDKLHLLFGNNAVDDEAVYEAVSDSARYDIYGLVDVALSGNIDRTTRMIEGLRAESVEPVLLVWVFSREIRSLLPLANAVENGMRVEQVVAKSSVWPKRKALVSQALQRHSSNAWQIMLQQCSKIDLTIKGLSKGDVWDELLQLILGVAGVPLFAASRYN